MTRYNCKVDGDQYRITKFDDDFNPEASYLTTLRECDCPAGHRETCRHRKMLPKFTKAKATRGEMFLNYETGRWTGEWKSAEPEEDIEPTITFAPMVDAPVPAGINLLDLANPAEVHNAIADAVGEPRIDLDKRIKEVNNEIEAIIATKPLRRL